MGLAEEIYASFAGATRLGVIDATLVKVTPGVRTPASQATGTNPTSSSYACKAFFGSFDSDELDGTTIKTEDRLVCIFAASISGGVAPSPGDKITADNGTYRIIGGQGNDGAGVLLGAGGVIYRCHARR